MTYDIAASSPGRGTRILVLLVTALCGTAVAPAARSADESQACAANAPGRQLDFWVGDWVVSNPGGAGDSSASKVRLALDQCVVIENWSDHNGHDVENIFGYSEGDAGWRGMFFDNRGHVHVFVEGKVVGELDIDSHSLAAFGADDQQLCEYAAKVLGRWLEQHA